jgi:NitT/TauT family transport system substrate-binding protein
MLALALGLSACSFAGNPQPADAVTLGTATTLEAAIPFFVADEQGFFARNGLAVTLKPYDTGLAAADGLLEGEVDVATAAEYILVGKAFANAPIQALASFDEVEFAHILGRKDRGIGAIADLKGKTIGVIKGTNQEFYLGRFLQLHGLSTQDVNVVDAGSMAQGSDAILGGRLDALVTLDPYAGTIQSRLGANAVVWPAQSSQPSYQVLMARDQWVAQRPQTARRLLNAIAQAEDYIAQHPAEAQAIARRRLGLSDADVAAVWARNDFSLSLDMGLVAAMEDEARWMIQNNLAAAPQVPDIVQYIYVDALQAVSPDAVNIIR